MTRNELIDLHNEVCEDCRRIMSAKNHDYTDKSGDDPFANFKRSELLGLCTAETGLLLRVIDKLSRLTTFATSGRLMVENESADDACKDIINYMVLLLGIMKERRDQNAAEISDSATNV